jgi:hypothetical protein
MFYLHEKRRRRVCRAVFLACCLAPTCVSAGWAIVVSLPPYRALHERSLAARLGLEVSIARVTSPRPGDVLYTDVELKDPETHERLAHARLLEIWRDGGLWTVRASQPELNEAGLAALWKRLENELHNQSASDPRIYFEAEEVLLQLSGGARSIQELRGRLERSETGPQAKFSFRLPGAELPRPVELTISRNRQAKPPLTRVDLNTSDAALPCRLLAAAWPAAGRLGPKASLRGSFWVADAPDGWQGGASGEIADIDLASLVNEQFPHHLSGNARLTLDKARVSQARLQEAAGTLSAGPGVVSRSLLAAAEESLHFVRADVGASEDKSSGEELKYEKLALAFNIDARGLAVRSPRHTTTDGSDRTILTDSAGALLDEPAEPIQPVINLVRTLVPQSEVLVPASQETNQLTQFLPIPAVVLKPGTLPEAHKIRVGAPLEK